MENVVLDRLSPDANVDEPVVENPPVGSSLTLPEWASVLLGSQPGEWREASANLRFCTRANDHFTLTSIVCPRAVNLSEAAFARSTLLAYRLLDEQLCSHDAGHLVRVWNFIPEILAALGDLPQRYMVFNAGRHAAYREWNRGEYCFETQVATASGVGHPGTDLVVHGLAAACRGIPVENPRQVPSYRYSARYGPVPPCFSRATRVVLGPERRKWLLVGGTASVRGEVTVFPDDLEAQIEETCRNLEALMIAGLNGRDGFLNGGAAGLIGGGAGLSNGGAGLNGSGSNGSGSGLILNGQYPGPCPALDHYRHLRVYYVHEAHRAQVTDRIGRRFQRAEIELVQADLCRQDLLIEIEGVAELSGHRELA